MDAQLKNALAEGVVDALGFVGGGLFGGLIARAVGADFMGDQGWGASSIAGILLVGLGAGLGKTLARKLLKRAPAGAATATTAQASSPARPGAGDKAVKDGKSNAKR